jgi:hypothetical protein
MSKKMMKSNVFFVFILCCLLTACNKEDDFLVEENPTSNIIDTDGHDFLIRGDIDGEEFMITHESNVQLNSPVNDDMSSSARPFFGTWFRIKHPGKLKEMDILFGITENGDSKFEDVVQVGTYGWYGFDVPSQSVGEAFVKGITFKEDRAMTSATWPHSSNPDNHFEITSITPLELDKNLDEIYSGKLYKVEGNFAVDLDKWDNSGDTPRLTIDYFSAIFYDNSL